MRLRQLEHVCQPLEVAFHPEEADRSCLLVDVDSPLMHIGVYDCCGNQNYM